MSRSTCQFLVVRAMLLLLVGLVILTIVASGEQGSSGHNRAPGTGAPSPYSPYLSGRHCASFTTSGQGKITCS
ncbi:unnamed protein product [Urochloa humidicola]